MSGGFTPGLKETTDPLSGWINVLASEHGMVKSVGITIDASSVDADGDGNKIVPNGQVLAYVASTKKYVPYVGTTAADEVQTIGLGAASAGSVTITFDGQTTGSIAYDADATAIQAALVALSNVAPGDVVVSGGPFPGVATLTFGGAYADVNVPQITATPTGLTGGTVTIATGTPGVSETVAKGVLVNGGVNLRDGDVITGMLIHGSVLEARLTGLDADAKAALSHILFQ
jgi:hypothetical protein